MSEEKKEEPPKKKGGMMMKLIIGFVLLAAGGGASFGLMASGMIPGVGGTAAAVDHSPQLVRKGEADPYAPADSAADAVAIVHGEGGNDYRTAYFTFEGEFTANLRNSHALIQLTLAASTQRDGRVLMWLREHELAIRSQLLIDLGDTPEEEVMTPDGKERLRDRLTGSINQILTQAEGYGGVDQVYFRTFIVQ